MKRIILLITMFLLAFTPVFAADFLLNRNLTFITADGVNNASYFCLTSGSGQQCITAWSEVNGSGGGGGSIQGVRSIDNYVVVVNSSIVNVSLNETKLNETIDAREVDTNVTTACPSGNTLLEADGDCIPTPVDTDSFWPINNTELQNRSGTLGINITTLISWVTGWASNVTLAGTPDYLTISGQTITRGLIDLTTDVTGLLPFANINAAQLIANIGNWSADRSNYINTTNPLWTGNITRIDNLETANGSTNDRIDGLNSSVIANDTAQLTLINQNSGEIDAINTTANIEALGFTQGSHTTDTNRSDAEIETISAAGVQNLTIARKGDVLNATSSFSNASTSEAVVSGTYDALDVNVTESLLDCVAITGSADLCDGSDDGGGSSESGWLNTSGSGNVSLAVSGVNVSAGTLFVDNTNGEVGIGTTNPSVELDVNNGQIKVGNSSENINIKNNRILFQNSNFQESVLCAPHVVGNGLTCRAGDQMFQLSLMRITNASLFRNETMVSRVRAEAIDNNSASDIWAYMEMWGEDFRSDNVTGYFLFKVPYAGTDTEIFKLGGNGAGLYTSSPAASLHVRAVTGDVVQRLEENTGGEYWEMAVTGAGSMQFRDTGTNVMTFEDGTGRVGLNDTTPDALFDVEGSLRSNELFVGGKTNITGVGSDNPTGICLIYGPFGCSLRQNSTCSWITSPDQGTNGGIACN